MFDFGLSFVLRVLDGASFSMSIPRASPLFSVFASSVGDALMPLLAVAVLAPPSAVGVLVSPSEEVGVSASRLPLGVCTLVLSSFALVVETFACCSDCKTCSMSSQARVYNYCFLFGKNLVGCPFYSRTARTTAYCLEVATACVCSSLGVLRKLAGSQRLGLHVSNGTSFSIVPLAMFGTLRGWYLCAFPFANAVRTHRQNTLCRASICRKKGLLMNRNRWLVSEVGNDTQKRVSAVTCRMRRLSDFSFGTLPVWNDGIT